MARALVIHYDPAEAAALAERVRRHGYAPEVYERRGAAGVSRIGESPPEVVVIDLRRMPSYGRWMGALLREHKSTRRIPLVFVNGDPEKTRLVRKLLPDAFFTPLAGLGLSIRKVLAAAPREPVLPDATRIPAAGKLNIREGAAVCLLNAPAGFPAQLGPVPPGVRFETAPDDAATVLFFAQSAARLARQLPHLAAGLRPGRALWVVWPKKASGVATDISMPGILECCSNLGLSCHKLCAVDKTWSAIGISRPSARKPARR